MVVFAGAAAALAQPANDLCANSLPLSLNGSVSGTTITATRDGTATCGNSATAVDVWYSFTTDATVAGQTLVFLISAANYDTVVSVHTACPGSGAQIGCDDDTAGSLRSRVTLSNLAANQALRVRVSGYNNLTGTFTLQAFYQVAPPPPPPPPPVVIQIGPDVWVNELVGVNNYTPNVNGVAASINLTFSINGANTIIPCSAYAIGTDACNKGDYWAEWVSRTAGSNRHPVIAQNMYRYYVAGSGTATARFEQIGKSWLKHGFLSLNDNACGTCQRPPAGGDQLGVNCSDIYSASLNGSQGNLGARSDVNATNGFFPIVPNIGTTVNATSLRLVVPRSQLSTSTVNNRYFAEAHYVTHDDAQWDLGLNNMTFAEVTPASIHSSNVVMNNAAFTNAQRKERGAIWAWSYIDPSVKIVNADLMVANAVPTFPLPVLSVGSRAFPTSIKTRYQVASKVYPLGGGMFRYEYAVFNINSDRSAGSISFPLPAEATVSNIGFNAPLTHSGEIYSNNTWTTSRVGDTLVFATQPFATNANANALRWSTMYNFRFDSNVAPTVGQADLGLFKPATGPSSLAITGVDVPTVPPRCLADVASDSLDTARSPNGSVGAEDLDAFITAFIAGSVSIADLASDGLDTTYNPNGSVGSEDLDAFIGAFILGC